MPQSTSLRIVSDQVERFRIGQITSQQMWDNIVYEVDRLTHSNPKPSQPKPKQGSMIPTNEFWLNIHQLAESIESEGLTSDERSDNIICQLVQMPYIAQRQVLTDLLRITNFCPDLYPIAVATANENEQKKKNTKIGRAS